MFAALLEILCFILEFLFPTVRLLDGVQGLLEFHGHSSWSVCKADVSFSGESQMGVECELPCRDMNLLK